VARRGAAARGRIIGTLPCALPAGAAAVAALASRAGDLEPAALAVLAAVGVGAVTDLRSGAICDPLTAALAGTALVAALARGHLTAALAGAVSAGGALLALHVATRGRGIGLGDVKLAAGVGAGLGAPLGLLALALAFVAGGMYGTWLLATNRARRGDTVRFGPFVAGGTTVALLLLAALR
jgi:leader peptidase (prepilin peptidase)/N-methyltransferase